MSTPPPVRQPKVRLGSVLYGLTILGIALAFQGTRGLFMPDEARYADAVLAMRQTGDWLVPRLQGLVYLDKPPAIYWSIAAGFELLGVNEWGARIGHSLALAATAICVTVWSASAWGKPVGRLAGAAYVTTLLPALAANALTPDTLLVLWTTLASFAYWQWRGCELSVDRWRWALLLGLSIGLALLTKGAATFVFLAPVGIHAVWESGPRWLLARIELWAAGLLAVALGLSWYVILGAEVGGAAQYFFDNQIAGRLWKETYNRNPQWWAAFKVYLPVLTLGSLPWSLTWLGLWRSKERKTRLAALWGDPLHRFLILSALLPLAIFSLAQSKLPLYILPVAPFLVMLTISNASHETGLRWGRRVLVAAAVVILMKGLAAYAPAKQDTRVLAEALARAGVTPDECVGALGTKIHGLGVYGYPGVTWHTIWPESYPYFEPPRMLSSEFSARLQECDGRMRFIVDTDKRPAAAALFDPAQIECNDEPLSAELTLLSCSEIPRNEFAPGTS